MTASTARATSSSLVSDAGEPMRFVFFLAPRFSMIAFAAAIEPLRLANRLTRRTLFDWRLAAEDGAPAHCSNGAAVTPDMALEDVPRDTVILVCGGLDAHLAASRPVLTWLRKQARRGAKFGAVCTGAWILAKAGFMEGRRCTIHWENREAFAEEFPDIDVSNRVYELDGELLTSAGGTSAADMMLDLISRRAGPDLASLVADQMILAPMRSSSEEQRLSVPARIGVRHPKLISIIQKMENHIEEPISPADLAAEVGMSTRQLERLFRRYLDRSPKRYYMELRLQKARNLLLQTNMSVINVALACGFTSPSHFSKCYRAQYGRTPYRERGAPRGGRDEG
jgi:transcriptional regulator GlxA family with amidase domain